MWGGQMFILYSHSSGQEGERGEGRGGAGGEPSGAKRQMHNCQISAGSILQSISARR